jgi:uncharacterized membrane protein YphA (DoxX/SURF4 family)
MNIQGDLGADLRWLSGIFLGIVFLISGVAKLVHPIRFRDTLAAMEVLPRRLTRWVAWSLPGVEILVGAATLAGWPPAGPLLAGLIACFLCILALYRWRGGKELVCGCFADLDHKTATWVLMVRNALLIAAGLPLAFVHDPPAQRGLEEWLLAATIVLGGMLAWLLVNRLAETIAVLRAERNADYG